jgi:hypothetical protein
MVLKPWYLKITFLKITNPLHEFSPNNHSTLVQLSPPPLNFIKKKNLSRGFAHLLARLDLCY